MTESILFFQLTAILILVVGLGFLTTKFKQPLIIAFILAGILSGPNMLNIISEQHETVIETLAEFGIALLLFVVGLKLDLNLIRKLGVMAFIAGILQISLTVLLGFLLSIFLQFDIITSVFISLALTFSSTIIVVKLLSDKRAIDTLYGQLSLGILIIQDLAIILIIIVITAFAGGSHSYTGGIEELTLLLMRAVCLITPTYLFIRYIAKPLTKFLANNIELMIIFCIAFSLSIAAICEYFHFGKELGGLLAGIALASTPYNNIIAARLSVLRDFLLLFFFTHIGANMSLGNIGNQIFPAIILSLFVLLGKPILIMGIMNILHYSKKMSVMVGLTLSQISEFSLIFMVVGVSAGLIAQSSLNLIMLVGLITMGLSTYTITYSDYIYDFLERTASKFGVLNPANKKGNQLKGTHQKYDVIVFGLGRYGGTISKLFSKNGFDVLGVDFNPEAIVKAQNTGITSIYGDASDPEFVAHLPLENVKVIIFSFHHYITGPLTIDLRRTLAMALRESGYQGHIAATSHNLEHDQNLTQSGINIILTPFDDAASLATEQIIRVLGQKKCRLANSTS